MCQCKPFCEAHGRDEIAKDNQGNEFCNECAADGWSGELCHPDPCSCDMMNPNTNARERGFMCEQHASEHKKFCDKAFAA